MMKCSFLFCTVKADPVAELVFYTGPMDSGKSTLALQLDYSQSAHDRQGMRYTMHDRSGHAGCQPDDPEHAAPDRESLGQIDSEGDESRPEASRRSDPPDNGSSGQTMITSRIGLSATARDVNGIDVYDDVVATLTTGTRVDYLICDEAQFYRPEQIDQLSRVVDDLGIDVFCFGILADFRTELFPGSRRLVELCDRLDKPPVMPLCWCGRPATHNARVVNGVMTTQGDQVVVGDTDTSDEVHYEVLCRRHHRQRITAERSRATLSEQTLPFDEV